MDKKKLLLVVGIVFLILLAVFGYVALTEKADKSGFVLNNILIKTFVTENQTLEVNLKITNFLEERYFQLSVKSLDEVMELVNSSLQIPSGQSRDVTLRFKGTKPGIYTGIVVVKTSTGEKDVPVVVSVSTSNPLFFTIIDESSSKDIVRGLNSNINIKLFNIWDNANHAVKISYLIKDLEGNTVSEEKENSVVVGSEAGFSKTLSIPSDFKTGNYVYGVITEYGSSISVSGYLFNVIDKPSIISRFNVSSFTLLFSVAVLVFLVGIIILFIYMIYERDKLFSDLKLQHELELKFYSDMIEKRSNDYLCKAKNARERKKITDKYKQIKEKAIRSLKEKHAAQINNYRALKKANKSNELKKKVNLWKKEGYDVDALNMAVSEKKDIRAMLSDWKKQGYDTDIIDK